MIAWTKIKTSALKNQRRVGMLYNETTNQENQSTMADWKFHWLKNSNDQLFVGYFTNVIQALKQS